MSDVTVLDVLLHEEPIGTLTHIGGDRMLFAFNAAYIGQSDRPVLGLSFKDQFGELITEFGTTRTRAMPFFSNLLPEGHLRTYLAERAGVKPVREFFLLWALGTDLPGAITIRPADGEPWPPDPRENAAGVDHPENRHHETALRFSLAGIQLKFSAVGEASGGLTIPAQGIGGSWIVKLPSSRFEGIPENEFSMLTLARLAGIDVPGIRLVDIEAIQNLPDRIGAPRGRALAVERFDRLPDRRPLHIEDFAQIFGVYPEKKYERASARTIANVIATECSQADVAEFVRRLTFSALIGNGDMHLKNWSVIYPDRRKAALAPAYDFVSTIPYIPGDDAALKFSRTRRFDRFTEDELAHLADKARLPEKLVLDSARETVSLFHQVWEAEKAHLPLSADVVRAIEDHLKTVPMA